MSGRIVGLLVGKCVREWSVIGNDDDRDRVSVCCV